jgi:glutamate carboxypeptidase
VLYMMMDCLKRFAPEFFSSVSWRLFFDATEETVSDDFGALCLERMDAATRACLVFESGAFSRGIFPLVTARKGRAVFSIESEGRSAHAGTSHGEGVNAIVGLSSLIKELSALTDYSRGVTINVGSVHGGGEVNRVPDRARAEMEMRAFDNEAFRETEEKSSPSIRPTLSGQTSPLHAAQSSGKYAQCLPGRKNEGSRGFSLYGGARARYMGYEAVPEHRGA